MKYLLFGFTCLLALPAQADFLGNFIDKITGSPSATEVISTTEAISSTLPTKATPSEKLTRAAHIRILDKRTNRTSDQTLTTTAPFGFDSISIQVLNCRRHHHQVGHHAAWFNIKDITDTTEKTPKNSTPNPPRFEGWMMSAFPAVAALEHPRYDVRIIECKR